MPRTDARNTDKVSWFRRETGGRTRPNAVPAPLKRSVKIPASRYLQRLLRHAVRAQALALAQASGSTRREGTATNYTATWARAGDRLTPVKLRALVGRAIVAPTPDVSGTTTQADNSNPCTPPPPADYTVGCSTTVRTGTYLSATLGVQVEQSDRCVLARPSGQ